MTEANNDPIGTKTIGTSVVTVHRHYGYHGATGKLEQNRLYLIRLDGRAVGTKSWSTNSKVHLHARVSPVEKERIEQAVSDILCEPVNVDMVPDVPAELLVTKSNDIEFGDLD